MTEEERLRQQAYSELVRRNKERVDMLSQSALTPEQANALAQQAGYSGKGREEMLADQLRNGQVALLGGKLPEGKTIGDIYVAPTWSESLNAGFEKALGGYQMGQARNEIADVDKMQGAALDATAQLEGEKNRQAQLTAAEAQQRGLLSDAQRAADAKAKREQDAALAAQREAGANRRALSRTVGSEGKKKAVYLLNPETGDHTTGYELNGELFVTGGNPAPTDMVPWNPGSAGSTAEGKSAKAEKAAREADPTRVGVTTPLTLIDTITNPLLDKAVGVFNPTRWMGEYGKGESGPQVQALQRQIEETTLGGLIPDLAKAQLKPVSDTDIDILKKKYATLKTEPFGHVEFAVDAYRPSFVQGLDDAVASGQKTPEERQQWLDRIDMGIVQGALKWGYPTEQLVLKGVNPEIIRLMVLKKKQAEGKAN